MHLDNDNDDNWRDYAESHPGAVDNIKTTMRFADAKHVASLLNSYEIDWLRGNRLEGACGAAVFEYLNERGLVNMAGDLTGFGALVLECCDDE